MSDPKKSSPSLNDEDLYVLFDDADVNIPPALDQSILKSAHDAVHHDIDGRTKAPSRRFPWGQGLSAAAVVVLGVVLVPIIISSPDTSLNTSAVEKELANLKATNELMPQQNPSTADTAEMELAEEMSADIADDMAAEISQIEEPREPAASPELAVRSTQAAGVVTESVQTAGDEAREVARESFTKTAKSVNNAMMDNANAEKPAEFRQTARLWIDEIVRLYEADDVDTARDEYVLFTLSYPNHDLISELPADVVQ